MLPFRGKYSKIKTISQKIKSSFSQKRKRIWPNQWMKGIYNASIPRQIIKNQDYFARKSK